MAWITLPFAIGVTLISSLAWLIYVSYRQRAKIHQLRRQGFRMPQNWSWIFGHLLVLQKARSKFPSDAAAWTTALRELALGATDTEVLLVDLWPVSPPLLIVADPEVAVQITNKYNLPKTRHNSEDSMKPIVGGPSIISMNGEEWKLWRGLFNPGFSAANMTTYVPYIVDCVQVFCEKLEERAGKVLFQLEDLTTRLTTEVIAKVTLDVDLNYQHQDHVLPHAFNTIINWHSMWNPMIWANPLRPLVQKYYGRIIKRFIRKELQARFLELQTGQTSIAKRGRAKSIIAIALEGYIAEQGNASGNSTSTGELNEHFTGYASNQIRLFLFAGNDTTSSSIIYLYHLLSQNPLVLEKLRVEHDAIFGPNVVEATDMLKEKPALLNQCHYTLAVVKETLRHYAPAGTLRSGVSNVVLTDRHNNSYPMDGICATIIHAAMHMNPYFWVRPTEFLPERFVVDPEHELYPNPAAYRPFEQGPRNCPGITLVYNEMRIALVLTARRFIVQPAYEEWDELQAMNMGFLKTLGKRLGVVATEPNTVYGDRAYQTDTAGTHPKDGYPCRVELLNRSL
ncbi:cytochrome P450 [Lindgomyces ingoldianus]|uniref:Cytochrome P450 n=1 Tax=Lindgomyces ingoldianus TaxID=673940 RepID=A0ACB6QR27_9PLEO|nr:cytochrome P450 [Lindgomyces ingoldianus]KAF2469381.1 cytochrome P450 [Lindgomyces ingoldianus]